MAIRFIRQPSETPNVTNADDARMVRYAYGGYDGYVAGKGSELSYSADGNIFRVNSGVINLQGWETEIDSNGWEMTVDNVAGSRYYAVYYEVNLSTQTTAIKSSYDTAGIPNIAAGDDLTAVSAGTGRMVLYTFRAQNGAISDVQKVVRAIPYNRDEIAAIRSWIENKKTLLFSGEVLNDGSSANNGEVVLKEEVSEGDTLEICVGLLRTIKYIKFVVQSTNGFAAIINESTPIKVTDDSFVGISMCTVSFLSNKTIKISQVETYNAPSFSSASKISTTAKLFSVYRINE